MDNITFAPFLTTTSALIEESITPEFTWYDYVIFIIMLTLSGGLGIFFGCFGDKQSSAKEYLLGGKNMKVIPVAISLVASHTSGITLLGVPADAYAFGGSYIMASFSVLIISVLTVVAFIPVFHELQLMSTYEYLALRFDERTGKCSSFLFGLTVFMFLPIVVYLSALVLSASTGIGIHLITPIICGICIFYTSIGGLKALIWIDTIQFTVTSGIVIVLLGLGIHSLGGSSKFWNSAPVQERMDILDFSLDFTKRDTMWAFIIGFTTHWMAHTSVNQGCVQKFLSVPSLRKTKWVIVFYCLGMSSIKGISVLLGLVMSAIYADCDPFVTKRIERNDQMLPYYVLNVSRNIPGLSGLFIAGVLNASLSTLSGNLNSLSGTIYEDFLRIPLAKKGFKNDGLVLKVLVVIIGVISTSLVYVVEHMGGVMSLAIGLGSVAHGPLLGMFLLGLFFPRANSKGSFYGAISSLILMSSVMIGGNVYKMAKRLKYPQKSISVDGCDFFVNRTVTSKLINETVSAKGEDIFPIFRISFYWYTFIGAMMCVLIGLVISYMTEENNPPVPRKFLSPVIHPLLSKDRREEDTEYRTVENARRNLSVANERDEEEKLKERLRKFSYISEKFDD